MGIGVISIQTNQRRENGAPFPAGSAANGLSVDPVTGQIVLGNDAGGVTAALLTNREIPLSGQAIQLSDAGPTVTTLQSGIIQMVTPTSTVLVDESTFQITRTNPGDGPAALLLNDAVFQVLQGMDGTGVYSMQSNIAGQFGSYDVQNGRWQVGLNPGGSGTFNGALLEVVGDITYDISVNFQGGTYSIDPDNDRGRLFTNEADTAILTLPAAPQRGCHFMFAVENNNNLQIICGVGDFMNIGGLQSIVGGSVISDLVGSFLHLVYIGNNQWIAASVQGAWVVT